MGNNHGGRFTDGLLLGMIIGGIAVFLLGTKKGNKILKALTEQGFDGLGEIARDLENEAKKETKTQLRKVESKIGDFEESIEVDGSNGNAHEEESKPQAKRFFRKPSAKN